MVTKLTRQQTLQHQIARLERRLASLRAVSDRYSWTRVILFLGGAFGTLFAFYEVGPEAGLVMLLLAVAAFALLVWLHQKVERSIARHEFLADLKSSHVARMQLDWSRISTNAEPSQRGNHPFENDLDLTGERSLHHLLDNAVTMEGSHRLRDWLLAPVATLETVHMRQAVVRELMPLVRFRDGLVINAMLAAREAPDRWAGKRLLRWLSLPGATRALLPLILGLMPLAVLNLLLIGLAQLALLPPFWVATSILYFGVLFLTQRVTGTLFDDARALQAELERLGAVLNFLETFPYDSQPHLRAHCQPILAPDVRPSRQVRRVGRVVVGAGMARNPMMWLLLHLLGPWDLFFAYQLNRFRDDARSVIPAWLEVWFDLEALSSLATFGYLNPGSSLPVVERTEGSHHAVLDGKALGHPLIPDERRVCNDFAIQKLGEVILITGSNMSGKSSFLRTLGVNLCLAYAGGPVVAASLQTRLFRLFTCIQVADSVTDGFSYFYAEVRRLKALLVALEEPHELPLFFLIDEIFRGTNNRERLIGSRSYIRALAGGYGTGAVSTHDLELVKLSDELPALHNYHFREEVLYGRMVFDYKLRPGPSPTTNALKIMEMEGLPVESAVESRV